MHHCHVGKTVGNVLGTRARFCHNTLYLEKNTLALQLLDKLIAMFAGTRTEPALLAMSQRMPGNRIAFLVIRKPILA